MLSVKESSRNKQVSQNLEIYDHEDRPVNSQISCVNSAIIDFFKNKSKNSHRIPWFNPDGPIDVPFALFDITQSMRLFFKKKRWYAGGPIPNELLYTQSNFHLINNIALIDAIDIAYYNIGKCKSLAKTRYVDNVEIAITLRVINECGRKEIQQDHIGGLLLIYLNLCEKVAIS